jgi:hypothetical protein
LRCKSQDADFAIITLSLVQTKVAKEKMIMLTIWIDHKYGKFLSSLDALQRDRLVVNWEQFVGLCCFLEYINTIDDINTIGDSKAKIYLQHGYHEIDYTEIANSRQWEIPLIGFDELRNPINTDNFDDMNLVVFTRNRKKSKYLPKKVAYQYMTGDFITGINKIQEVMSTWDEQFDVYSQLPSVIDDKIPLSVPIQTLLKSQNSQDRLQLPEPKKNNNTTAILDSCSIDDNILLQESNEDMPPLHPILSDPLTLISLMSDIFN